MSRPGKPGRRRVGRGVIGATLATELLAIVVLAGYASAWEPRLPPWHPEFQPRPFVYRADVGRPISDTVRGITMFRGNATRTWYGQGPVPSNPRILWRFPAGRPMCAHSRVGRENPLWCGSGWTGQPAVVERDDGVEVIVGTYDKQVHFLDGATGRERRPPFATGDIIKGSVTVDPDGYPLVYIGSPDRFCSTSSNRALRGARVTVRLHACAQGQ